MTLLTMDPLSTTEESSVDAAYSYKNLSSHLEDFPDGALSGSRIIVVGGGAVGLMSAFFAARAGAHVQLFEAQSLGGAASGRNGGAICALGREIEEVPLARASIDTWERLTADGIDTHFRRAGHLLVAMDADERALLEVAAQRYSEAGLEVKLLSQKDTVDYLPAITPGTSGSLLVERDGQAYPFSTYASLSEKLRRMGAAIHERSPVRAITSAGGRATGIISNLGRAEADHVILCTGPWTRHLGLSVQEEFPVHPRRSQIMVTQRVGWPAEMPFVSGNRIYSRRTHAGNIMTGGGGPWEINGYDVQNSYHGMSFIAGQMAELFPGLASVPVVRAFAGTVELTPDHLPLFGPAANLDRLWVSAGYNGHGFGMSAVMGRLAVDLLHAHSRATVPSSAVMNAIEKFDPPRFNRLENP